MSFTILSTSYIASQSGSFAHDPDHLRVPPGTTKPAKDPSAGNVRGTDNPPEFLSSASFKASTFVPSLLYLHPI